MTTDNNSRLGKESEQELFLKRKAASDEAFKFIPRDGNDIDYDLFKK